MGSKELEARLEKIRGLLPPDNENVWAWCGCCKMWVNPVYQSGYNTCREQCNKSPESKRNGSGVCYADVTDVELPFLDEIMAVLDGN